MSSNGSKPKKRRFSKLLIFFTILLQLIASAFICLAMVVYGPFGTIRSAIIGSAMTTFKHQYIAKMLFSQAQIDAVMDTGKSVSVSNQKTKVTPTKIGDPGITQESISSGSYNGYLLKINDPTRVKLAVTSHLTKAGENVSDMAADLNAVAAINGGGFGDSGIGGTGAHASDFIIQDGVLKDVQVAKDEKRSVIAMDEKGQLVVGIYCINDLTSKTPRIINAVTMDMAGFALIVDGKEAFKNSQQTASAGYAPRTAIGQTSDGSILFLVLDGRRLNMKGASLYDVQKIMKDHGAYTAANLDGGNSSVMYYNGNVITNPSGEYGERTVATSFYVESTGS